MHRTSNETKGPGTALDRSPQYVIRRYCRTGRLFRQMWNWEDVTSFDDEAEARQHFMAMPQPHSGNCRGYALVRKSDTIIEVIATNYDYRR